MQTDQQVGQLDTDCDFKKISTATFSTVPVGPNLQQKDFTF